MFDGIFGSGDQLATSVDAYLDRLEKILRIRAMLAEQKISADVTKGYDEAIMAVTEKMTADVMAAKEKREKEAAEAEKAKESEA